VIAARDQGEVRARRATARAFLGEVSVSDTRTFSALRSEIYSITDDGYARGNRQLSQGFPATTSRDLESRRGLNRRFARTVTP
jgi:hypothetical protein